MIDDKLLRFPLVILGKGAKEFIPIFPVLKGDWGRFLASCKNFVQECCD